MSISSSVGKKRYRALTKSIRKQDSSLDAYMAKNWPTSRPRKNLRPLKSLLRRASSPSPSPPPPNASCTESKVGLKRGQFTTNYTIVEETKLTAVEKNPLDQDKQSPPLFPLPKTRQTPAITNSYILDYTYPRDLYKHPR